MKMLIRLILALFLSIIPFIVAKPVYACLTSNPGNLSCNPSYYKANPTVKVRLTQTSEVKVWFPNNDFPVVLVVTEPGKQAMTYYWDQRQTGVASWDTRTVTVPLGQTVEVSYTFKICYSGDKNSCENAYGWLPANTGANRYSCGTGCQCSGYPNGTYYGQNSLTGFVTAVQNQLNGATFYNLASSGYSLFNASQRQAGSADNSLTCWNDNYTSGAGADFNDWGVLWTVKAANVAVAPTVTTTAVTSIATTTATSGGNVTADGGSAVLERGIVYSASQPTPTTENGTKVVTTGTTGNFTSSLSGLSPVTRYYVRAYARNAIGTSYGTVVQFVTIGDNPANPGVSTGAVSALTTNSFSIAGNVTSAGDGTITERGFIYTSAVSDPTINADGVVTGGTKKTVTGTTGQFSTSITGLTNNTTYRIRAYVLTNGTVKVAMGAVVEARTGASVTTQPPTHTPTDTGIEENFLFFAGAILYGIGIVVFMGAKVLGKDLGKSVKFRIVL